MAYLIQEVETVDVGNMLESWIGVCIREAGGAGSEAAGQQIVPADAFAAPARKTKLHTIVQGGRTLFYMKAWCYEAGCQRSVETGLYEHDTCVYAEMTALRWRKPTSKPWSHVRCPEHGW